MALTSQQIVSLATQVAKCPGFTAQAGQFLNSILQELCQTYDFDIARGTTVFNFSLGVPDKSTYSAGAGPNSMPTDFLRVRFNEAFYVVPGVGQPYHMIGAEQDEFDSFYQQSGFSAFPTRFYVDMSESPPALYVWPPAQGAYAATVRYQRQMPDITTPETNSAVPWFPFSNYLVRRLAGELMLITDDDRAPSFLGEDEKSTPSGAGVLLRKYLELKDDPENTVKTIKLDPRRFGTNWKNLPPSKITGGF